MPAPEQPALRKELSLFGVFAIATGTTLSAGFFLLPGLAVKEAGPALVLSYMIAAALMVPGMLCIVELSTAMPRAGGAYYFLDRSLGPLAGTIGGVGTWLALTLKTAFALVGMGAYLSVLFSIGGNGEQAIFKWIAVGLAVLFGGLNLLSAKRTSGIQIILVCGLLAILGWFVGDGATSVERANFEGFWSVEPASIFATAGLVFISYVGVTKVASVSEEVRDPERNLPLGIFLALGTAVLIYALGVGVMVGVLGRDGLEGSYTCVADTAAAIRGPVGMVVVSVGAILAFSSVANGAILSASRYPLAMARDHLVPSFLRKVAPNGAPTWSVVLTALVVVGYIVLLDPMAIAKLASAFQLLMFSLLCGAVIVMRESRIESYDPGFRAPLYPWIPLLGIFGPVLIIFQMGSLTLLFSTGLVLAGIAWYWYYGKDRVARHGAIYDVFDRLSARRFYDLDRELRGILKEKGLRKEDPFDECIVRCQVVEAAPDADFEHLVRRASFLLAPRVDLDVDALVDRFRQGTRTGATPVTGGVALPHLREPKLTRPELVIARSRDGVAIDTGDDDKGPAELTHAVFFLISPAEDAGQHLRLLAQLASQVEEDGFLDQWRSAENDHDLKEILLRNEQYLSLDLHENGPTTELIDKEIRELALTEGVLVALIRREDEPLIPRGSTVLRAGDRLTIIGDADPIARMRRQFLGG